MLQYPPEPFRIKVVERIKIPTMTEREQLLQKAFYNVFNIPAEKVYIDLLTDSGTGAMSDNQWAGLQIGDEAYACCRNWYHFEDTIRELTGLKIVVPVHQGRVAENLLFTALDTCGKIVINNNHFDTTRANVLAHGGIPLDLVIPEGRDILCEHPFKGNMDVERLEQTIHEHGPEKIALVMLTITNNSGGGQPVAIGNIRAVKEVVSRYGIPLFFDACRFAENAYFIKMREPGYATKSVREIAQEMFSYVDGCTMSAKKDGLANIGGFLALNDEQLAERIMTELVRIEGFLTYGGMAGRDLEAVTRGLVEVLDDDYLEYRIKQVQYFGELLLANAVPILRPTGGHAVYLDAKRFAPHVPPEQFPGQAIVVELYRRAAVRAVEVGSFMFNQTDPVTGKALHPPMELVRLAIPRRVYTETHLRYVAEAVIALYQDRNSLRGMRIIGRGSSSLRHFVAQLTYVE